jgi:hypothetical protein
MNCAEFQEILPEVFEGERNAEQEAHLRSCAICSGLVADLDLISREARHLQAFAEPSPRVWNSIEIALRQEGLIREPQRPSLVPPLARRRWTLAWFTPVAAVALLALGVFFYQRGPTAPQPIAQVPPTVPAAVVQKADNHRRTVADEDQQLLEAVASRSPAVQAAYASNLESVNAYIRDAEESAQADPSDEEAQQSVMDAYGQRATVYEMALDRSLP